MEPTKPTVRDIARKYGASIRVYDHYEPGMESDKPGMEVDNMKPPSEPPADRELRELRRSNIKLRAMNDAYSRTYNGRVTKPIREKKHVRRVDVKDASGTLTSVRPFRQLRKETTRAIHELRNKQGLPCYTPRLGPSKPCHRYDTTRILAIANEQRAIDLLHEAALSIHFPGISPDSNDPVLVAAWLATHWADKKHNKDMDDILHSMDAIAMDPEDLRSIIEKDLPLKFEGSAGMGVPVKVEPMDGALYQMQSSSVPPASFPTVLSATGPMETEAMDEEL